VIRKVRTEQIMSEADALKLLGSIGWDRYNAEVVLEIARKGKRTGPVDALDLQMTSNAAVISAKESLDGTSD
jgi:hypothetical protein